jgi:hypothetical protein
VCVCVACVCDGVVVEERLLRGVCCTFTWWHLLLLLLLPAAAHLHITPTPHCCCCIPLQELLACLMALLRVDRAWLPTRPGHSLYIRPFAFGSEGALGVHASSSTTLAVILSPVGPYFSSGNDVNM